MLPQAASVIVRMVIPAILETTGIVGTSVLIPFTVIATIKPVSTRFAIIACC